MSPHTGNTAPGQPPSAGLRSFVSWMRSVGISWSEDAITLVEGPAAGPDARHPVSVRAARDINEGETLCTIPKSACLTCLTSPIADILEDEQLGGGLGLGVAVMYEMSLGPEKSSWGAYFESMPQRENIPVFWDEEKAEKWLQGTELAGLSAQDREAMADDFESCVAPLPSKYPDRLSAAHFTLPHFHAAMSLVASRAFGVDAEHGDGMVPLADSFNHKVSVVDLAPGYVVHGAEDDSSDPDSDGDEESGSDGGGGEEEDAGEEGVGSEEDASNAEEERSGEGKQQTKPCCKERRCHDHSSNGREQRGSSGSGGEEEADEGDGVMRRSDAEHGVRGITRANGLALPLEIAIVDKDDDEGDALEIVAASALVAGSEVYNTYGELGNADLLKKYGFVLRQNPFTVVQLRKDDVVAACRALHSGEDGGGAERAKKRQKKGANGKEKSAAAFDRLLEILDKESDLLDPEEEPFVVGPNGHVDPALFATLRVLCSGADAPCAAPAVTSLADAFTTPEGAAIDLGSVGETQLWVVADADGERLAGTPEANEEIESATQRLITAPMCVALLAAVEKRLEDYPQPLEQTLALSKKGGGGNGEEGAARQAALILAATEQEVLHGVRIAAERRLKNLPTRSKTL